MGKLSLVISGVMSVTKRGAYRLLWEYIAGRPELEHTENLPRGERVWFKLLKESTIVKAVNNK